MASSSKNNNGEKVVQKSQVFCLVGHPAYSKRRDYRLPSELNLLVSE